MSMQFGNQKIAGISFMSDNMLSNVSEICRYVDGVKKTSWQRGTLLRTQLSGDAYFTIDKTSKIFYLGDFSIQSPYKEKIGTDKNNILEIDCSNEITAFDYQTCYNCKNLTYVNCKNITYLGNNAFCGCSSLYQINCENVLTVGSYAFGECSSLYTLNCEHVLSINDYTFDCCENLSTLILSAITTVPTIKATTFNTSYKLTAIVPSTLVDSFKTAKHWKTYYETGNLTLSGV